MSMESRQLFEWAHLSKAIEQIRNSKLDGARKSIEISKTWPQNLGVGKPYNVDEKVQDILIDYINNPSNSAKYRRYLATLAKDSQGYELLLIRKARSMMRRVN